MKNYKPTLPIPVYYLSMVVLNKNNSYLFNQQIYYNQRYKSKHNLQICCVLL